LNTRWPRSVSTVDEEEATAYLQANAAMEAAARRIQQARPYLSDNSEIAEELAAALAGGEWDKLVLNCVYTFLY
jgi:hypothetical protein